MQHPIESQASQQRPPSQPTVLPQQSIQQSIQQGLPMQPQQSIQQRPPMHPTIESQSFQKQTAPSLPRDSNNTYIQTYDGQFEQKQQPIHPNYQQVLVQQTQSQRDGNRVAREEQIHSQNIRFEQVQNPPFQVKPDYFTQNQTKNLQHFLETDFFQSS